MARDKLSARQAAVASNVLAPPSLSLEQVVEMQEAEIAEYSKPEFQNELYATLSAATPEELAHLRQELCLKIQVPIVAQRGFEPTALGVSQATQQILRYHGEGKAPARSARVGGAWRAAGRGCGRWDRSG
ncbi:unnamed protein product [Effrenium voratum]|uniref:Uncharacterized protein n=1 Tax=Effrenium voratum TaxID=2562239 RepID=A0AA36IWD5_9DINO|nr:unnamed protein product [Effrenium voratum]